MVMVFALSSNAFTAPQTGTVTVYFVVDGTPAYWPIQVVYLDTIELEKNYIQDAVNGDKTTDPLPNSISVLDVIIAALESVVDVETIKFYFDDNPSEGDPGYAITEVDYKGSYNVTYWGVTNPETSQIENLSEGAGWTADDDGVPFTDYLSNIEAEDGMYITFEYSTYSIYWTY